MLVAQLLFLYRLGRLGDTTGVFGSEGQRLQQLVQSGMVFSVVCAVVLSALFYRRVGNRLINLKQYWERLPQYCADRNLMNNADEIDDAEAIVYALSFELATARERERAIADFAMDIICSLDEEGRIVAASPATIRIWGYSPGELIGRRLASLTVDEDHLAVVRQLERMSLSTGECQFETRIICRDGHIMYMSWTAEWSKTERRIFCVGQDVTAQRILDLHKRQFVALLSHDLRSPLTAITLDVEQVLDYADEMPKAVTTVLRRTAEQVQRLTTLTNCLVDVEQIESGNFKIIVGEHKCADLIELGLASVSALASARRIELQEFYRGIYTMRCDRERTIQVIVNLLSNAIKFSPDNSVIVVRCENGQDDRVRIEVVDQGAGVPTEEVPKLFERFSQLDQRDEIKRKGSGLGLYICKKLVSAQAGFLGYQPAPRSGSCFWFELPGHEVDESE